MKISNIPMTIAIFLVVFALFPSETGTDPPPLRVGFTVSRTGTYKEPSEMIEKGYMLWQREVNNRGGLFGRKVKFIIFDDQSKPYLARRYYTQLIANNRVDLVFSPYGTPLTLEASKVTERYRYPLLACAAASDILWNRRYRYIFGMYAVADRYFIGLLDIMARNGYRSVALVYSGSSPFHQDIARGVREWAKRFKITVVYDRKFEQQDELPAIVQSLKKQKINSVIVSAYPPNSYELLRVMKVQKYKPRVLGMPIIPIHPKFWKEAGSMANNVFGPSQWEPNERIPYPGTKKFVRDFIEFTGKTPSYHAGSAYSSSQIFQEAIIKTGSFNRERIRNYIAALDTVTVIGRFKVDDRGKQIGHNTIIIQWQNGKKEIVWPLKMQTKPPVF